MAFKLAAISLAFSATAGAVLPAVIPPKGLYPPKGYTLDSNQPLVHFDFDGDGGDDYATALLNARNRHALWIALKKGPSYETHVLSEKACGSDDDKSFHALAFDPKTKVLTLSYDSGGTMRVGSDFKFRHQKGDFFLIGSTHQNYMTGPNCKADTECQGLRVETNYSTGKYEEIFRGKKPKVKKLAQAKPVSLKDFDPENFAEPHVE